jgi:hypothetical protein
MTDEHLLQYAVALTGGALAGFFVWLWTPDDD